MRTKSAKVKKVLLVISLLILFSFLSLFFTITYFYNKYPLNLNKLTSVNNGIKVYSYAGKEQTLYNTNRSIVEIETLPEYVKQAFISVEDKRFYQHGGFDIVRIAKAALVNLKNGEKTQGASTISQQLVKNTLLSNEKTYSRKIKEIVLAIKMEKLFNKDEILEMYLNTIYFGSNAYGIENASLTFFNKSAKDLTLNEACCLAGLIKSPNYYSPKYNIDNANKRKNLVAELMLETDKITKTQYNSIINENISVDSNSYLDQSYEREAIYEACKLLNLSERELINKNYEIITFKDDELQQKIIKANNDVIEKHNSHGNLDSLSAVVNNQGHIVAYYANSYYDLHNLKRQSASTLKPLAVYLPCVIHNIMSPSTHILDEKINYNGFSPKNADNVYHGYVSCEYALANSLNTPAVKLLDNLGIKKSKATLENLGITLAKEDNNLSLALGATKNGINLLDLLGAYSTLANMGTYTQPCFVNKILDKEGNEVYNHEKYTEKALLPEDCFLINKMLKQTVKSGTANRLDSLNLNIASKTGTASTKNGNTDLYNICYTTEHTMLTWIADIKNTYLPANLLSSSQPTDINKDICKILYSNHTPADFMIPENIVYKPYSLKELEKNHIIVAPYDNELERYIAYDYFKVTNQPEASLRSKENLVLDVEISKSGSSLTFFAEKGNNYLVYKKVGSNINLLNDVIGSGKVITINDYNIFKHDEIIYYIADSKKNVLSKEVKIRPKEYLISLLENELISTKKKWYV